jgi:hypothetical protein
MHAGRTLIRGHIFHSPGNELCPPRRAITGVKGLKLGGVEGFCNRACHNQWLPLEEAKWIKHQFGEGSYSKQSQSLAAHSPSKRPRERLTGRADPGPRRPTTSQTRGALCQPDEPSNRPLGENTREVAAEGPPPAGGADGRRCFATDRLRGFLGGTSSRRAGC